MNDETILPEEDQIVIKSTLMDVDLKDIKVHPRYRKDYGELKDLVDSIKEKGVLQPISLNRNFELAAGGRRFAAAAMAGLTSIPCIIRDTEELIDRLEVELFENIHRKNMEWHEEVKLVKDISDLYQTKHGKKWTQRKTAALLNKSLGGVSDAIKMAQAIETIPELKNCKTQNDAVKVLKKADKHVEIQTARALQEEMLKKSEHGLDYVRMAKSNFQIGDAFAGLKDLQETYERNKSTSMISFIEVDPPYAIDLNEVKKKGNITPDELAIYKEISKENYPMWLVSLASAIYKVAAPNSWMVFWFGPTWFTEVKYALITAGWKVDDIPGVWVKGEEDSEGFGQTNQPNLYLGRCYEPFFICRKGDISLNKPGRSNVFNFKPVPSSKKYHPTQRPIELIEDILQTFVRPGAVVMVPFLGSGTTVQAAYRQDMSAFGWELNAHNKDEFLLMVENDSKLKEKSNG